MPAIGITGGIATGKTAFCESLQDIVPGAKFFNADHAAHDLPELPDVRQEIRAEFGTGVFSRNGDLNRDKLRAIIFNDATKKRALEQILHPRIRRQWSAEAKRHRNSPDFFVADIPLLYETGGEALCDWVVVVACSYKVQLARLTQRMSLKNAEAEQMIKSQMPLDDKIARANHVVWNDGNHAGLMEQARFLAGLWQQQSWTKK
jgi:dephospho-CoA kinase